MGMDIAVLGVDLGKNVCSAVGLDASGAVVMRRKVKKRDLDYAFGDASAVHRRHGGLLRRSSPWPAVRRTWSRRTAC
jgi:hypothetical protein